MVVAILSLTLHWPLSEIWNWVYHRAICLQIGILIERGVYIVFNIVSRSYIAAIACTHGIPLICH